MEMDAEFFVMIGFFLFVLLLGYLGVHNALGERINARINTVKDELAEAARLRQEAQALLDSLDRKKSEAEAEAAAIIAQAKSESEMIAKEAQARMEEFVARRTKQAQDKIALAETQATADVRHAAADAAALAAETILKGQAAGVQGEKFVSDGLQAIRALAS